MAFTGTQNTEGLALPGVKIGNLQHLFIFIGSLTPFQACEARISVPFQTSKPKRSHLPVSHSWGPPRTLCGSIPAWHLKVWTHAPEAHQVQVPQCSVSEKWDRRSEEADAQELFESKDQALTCSGKQGD